MPKIIEIAVSENPRGQMKSVNNVEAIAGQGLVNHYHFKNGNEKRRQITLIEIENINHYNQIFGTSILPKDFRRNIITEGVKLNELVGSKFFISSPTKIFPLVSISHRNPPFRKSSLTKFFWFKDSCKYLQGLHKSWAFIFTAPI